MKTYIKRFLIFVLSAILVIAPAAAYANTSLGGWTALDSLIVGSNTTINAVKGAGSTALKSAITVAPNALKVGGFLLRGGAVGALALAIPQLIGEGVDYVLDPANNTVTYNDASAPSPPFHPSNQYYWQAGMYNKFGQGSTTFAAASALCKAHSWSFVSNTSTSVVCMDSLGENKFGSMQQLSNSYYDPTAPAWSGQSKIIPIADVTTQVIANADAGHLESQDALKAVAIEGFVAGDYDTDLEAAAVPDTSVDTGTGTGTGTGTSDPATTSDNTLLDSIKSFLSDISSSITSLSDFVKSDPVPPVESTDVVVDSSVTDFETDKSYITFAGSCPPNYTASMSIMGNTVPFSFDYGPICTVMSALKPFILGAGYLTAAYIIAGYSRGTNG